MNKIGNAIGIMTSGGDAPGMNAAVRAVVRTAINRGVDAYAIYDGYQGMVDGTGIKKMDWHSVGGILEQGGTIIGTARCKEFRERDGRRKAVLNLVKNGITRLVVIGGDGSLTGASMLSEEWPSLLRELQDAGQLTAEEVAGHPQLRIVGLVGSIDNDMADTDMTIGADTALKRITDAVDALASTAASHQRTFVVEVMGRNCGYLALVGAVATGASWVLIPEMPPEPGWEDKMCELIRAGTQAGRRDSIVLVAEGARDRQGQPITSAYVKDVLEKKLNRDVRITVLGHVQRGGAPTAFDRYMSTVVGFRAVEQLFKSDEEFQPVVIGIQKNRAHAAPLMESVAKTRSVADKIAAGKYQEAIAIRGASFGIFLKILNTMMQAVPKPAKSHEPQGTFAVMTVGWPAAGMNPAVRTAIRMAMDNHYRLLCVNDGFQGLIDDDFKEYGWMDVDDWIRRGGSMIGANRKIPEAADFYKIARNLEKHNIQGLMMIGGWAGYQGMHALYQQRNAFPAFNIPMVCIPATISNNLPGAELSIGADTAVNNIVEAIDKIKHSSDSARRAFLVEVMGRYCGYLTLMSGIATGAEVMYFHEEGITLERMENDLKALVKGFKKNRHLALIIRNENANPVYTTDFIASLFEEAGEHFFDVRKCILGPIQQGGNPAPFDRARATRLAYEGINFLMEQHGKHGTDAVFLGLVGGVTGMQPLKTLPELTAAEQQRPVEQWWTQVVQFARDLSKPEL